ncbi:MAG: FHA domain-containing protein, partial [Planctomycetes bacterium]|nr:FHA domain-containing protein [Planctomycetota bacterium]
MPDDRFPLLLRIKDGGGTRDVSLTGAEVFDLGRDAACAVPLKDTACSRRHVELRLSPDGWEVVDLGSRNGSLLNGKRVERAPFGPGDTLAVGNSEILRLLETVASGARVAVPAPAAPSAAPAAAPPLPAARSAKTKTPAPVAARLLEPSQPVPIPAVATRLPPREPAEGAAPQVSQAVPLPPPPAAPGPTPAAPGSAQADPALATTVGKHDPPSPAFAVGMRLPSRGLPSALIVGGGLVLGAVAVLGGWLLLRGRFSAGEVAAGAPAAAPTATADAGAGSGLPREWEAREASADPDEILAYYLAEETRRSGTPLGDRAAARAAWWRQVRDSVVPHRL